MALVVKDRVKQFSTTSGTGTITLGATPTGFQAFSVIGDGSTTYYAIVDNNNGEWEVGLGIYTASGTTLSRDTVLESSNAGSLVNFSSDTKEVFVTYPAAKSVYEQANGNVELPANLAFTGTGNRITGDFSNATIADRTAFQTSIADSNSNIQAIPNGTATNGGFFGFNNSDPTNAAFIGIETAAGTEARVNSGITGTGTYLPMTFFTGGSERVRIDTSGDIINNGVFYYNSRTVSANSTLSTTSNAMSVGPITINSGVTVTVPDGAEWLVT